LSEGRYTVVAAGGDGVTGEQTGIAIPSYTTAIFMWETATGVAATMEGPTVPPDITRDTNRVIRAIVRRAIPDTGVRQLRLYLRMPARTLAQATQVAIGLEHLRLYRPMPGAVRARCRPRLPATGRVRSQVRDPLRSPANGLRLSPRVRIRSLDLREAGRKVLAATKVWPEVVEARAVSNPVRCKFHEQKHTSEMVQLGR
jgi:hypothetical protein